jgi:hypothetical protein
MGFSMKGPSMSISYGGETNKQQKSNLMKDNPVAKHASAMHMAGKKAVAYQQEEESPMELTAEGKKKIMASDANPSFKKAIAKSPLNQDRKVKKAVRKAKKYIKAKESVKKQEEKGNYNSFREEGTKKAKRKVKKASKKHDKMRKAVDKLSTSEKKEALKTFKK